MATYYHIIPSMSIGFIELFKKFIFVLFLLNIFVNNKLDFTMKKRENKRNKEISRII